MANVVLPPVVVVTIHTDRAITDPSNFYCLIPLLLPVHRVGLCQVVTSTLTDKMAPYASRSVLADNDKFL
jgi:hypothetical protein